MASCAPATGETVKLPDHAATLRDIARTGGESFYRGAIADRIDAAGDAGQRLPPDGAFSRLATAVLQLAFSCEGLPDLRIVVGTMRPTMAGGSVPLPHLEQLAQERLPRLVVRDLRVQRRQQGGDFALLGGVGGPRHQFLAEIFVVPVVAMRLHVHR